VHTHTHTHTQGPFAKFVDSPYFSESKLSGGAVTVSFSKYLTWQAIHFLQRSTHFSKTCCRPLIASKFLASELPFYGWKSPEVAWGEIWIEFCVRLGKVDQWSPIRTSAVQFRSRPMRFLGFSTMKRKLRGKKFRKWSTVCTTFLRSGWSVVRSASLAKGGTSRKRPSPHLHKFRLGVIRWIHELCKRPSYICAVDERGSYFRFFRRGQLDGWLVPTGLLFWQQNPKAHHHWDKSPKCIGSCVSFILLKSSQPVSRTSIILYLSNSRLRRVSPNFWRYFITAT
jgi:hypothetical protein